MSKPRKPTSPEHAKLPIRFTRRTTLRMLGTAFATTPLTAALGCAGPQQAPSAEPDEPSSARAATQPMAAAPVSNSPSQAATSSNASTAKPSAAQVAGASAQPSSGAMPSGSNNAAAGAGNLGPSTPSMQGQAPNGMSAQAGAAGQASSAQAGASATAPTLASGWAMGGTAALANAGSYPSPFESKLDASCVRTEPMTLGPCHDNQAPEREDISEKQPGLPMRFGLRIVNEKCEPISNANVDIWHCDTQGVYSS